MIVDGKNECDCCGKVITAEEHTLCSDCEYRFEMEMRDKAVNVTLQKIKAELEEKINQPNHTGGYYRGLSSCIALIDRYMN